jgi:hypothetical protein
LDDEAHAMKDITRRQFVVRAAVAGAALQLTSSVAAPAAAAAESPAAAGKGATTSKAGDGTVELHWLEGAAPAAFVGATCGVAWPRGVMKRDQTLQLRSGNDESVAVQTWPLAHWPDGSLKWTALAIGPTDAAPASTFVVAPGAPAAPKQALTVKETDKAIEIDTGVIRCRVGRGESALIQSIERDGREICRGGRLICLRQDQPELSAASPLRSEEFSSRIERATLEQNGPVRAVVRLDGKHHAGERAWLPFTVRLYFYAGGESVRIMHTFIFDGDEKKDFICGLGVRFDVPMSDVLHDRHIRFVGEAGGLWAESVRNLSGLRRDPGRAVIDAQLAGKACPPVSQMPDAVGRRLELIPAWGDFTLSHMSSDSFSIRKRTKDGQCWITADHGDRAAGVGYIGGANGGGVAFGMRYFWQRHPTQLDVRGATGDAAQVTIWLWSPDAPAMDLRPYHDEMGMDTHAKQLEGLEITYEDYEPGFDTPHGVARTNELFLWALPATPTRERTVHLAQAVQQPAQLVARPQDYLRAGVFGALWTLPDRSTPAKKRIEDELDFLFGFYQKQIEQRHWYGFWNHGDVMHSYDRDRHVWRYDVGGYAWDNSELSPDLWLWYAFLRSGRADVFRMAEAMTRHTGEVDVYHLGKFAGLGSRHNVLHWGCSAKQLRISTAIYRRFYYFLTGDERVGDLMRDLVDADKTFMTLDPIRKIRREKFTPQPHALGVGLGTDWSALAAAWFTQWERTGDETMRQRLLNNMRSIAALPHGFFTAGPTYDPETGRFTAPADAPADVSHLSAVFGLPEICAELVANLDVPEFEKVWLQYCELYSASPEEQERGLGTRLRGNSLRSAHSRLTAYAAHQRGDDKLARRAWNEFQGEDRHLDGAPRSGRYSGKTLRIEGPHVLNPIDEAAWISTNDAAQWSLAAMQNLALVGGSTVEPNQ